MSDLKQRLQSDLTEAIRARDDVRSATLRMALTAVKSAEVAGKQARALADPEVIGVLGKEAKKRREAADAFAAAGREASAERELAELAVLQTYLPAPLTDAELAELVSGEVAAAASSGASGPAAMGRVIKAVQAKASGRAEGGRIAAEVRRQLG